MRAMDWLSAFSSGKYFSSSDFRSGFLISAGLTCAYARNGQRIVAINKPAKSTWRATRYGGVVFMARREYPLFIGVLRPWPARRLVRGLRDGASERNNRSDFFRC